MNLVKSFSVYLFSTVVEKGIGFLMLPLLTARLLPESIGKLSLITSTYAFLSPLILLSTSGAIFVEYHKSEDRTKFAGYFSTGLLLNFIMFFFFMCVILFGLDDFVKQINCPKEWVLAIPLFCLFDAIKVTALSILQVIKKPLYFSLVSLTYTIVNFGVSLLLVYHFGFDYEGRLSGIFVSGLLISFFSITLFYRMKILSANISRAYFTDILRYGIPLLPHAIGFLVLDVADRFFLNHFAGKAALGIYSISYLMAGITYVLSNSFSTAWSPHMYDELKKNTVEADLKIVKISVLYIATLLLFCILLSLAMPLLYRIFINPNYYSGMQYTYIIISAYFFLGIYQLFAQVIFYEKKNYIFGSIALFNVFVNLVLNYILIKNFQAVGAALATAISMFMFMVIVIYFSYKVKPLPWKQGFLNVSSGLLKRK